VVETLIKNLSAESASGSQSVPPHEIYIGRSLSSLVKGVFMRLLYELINQISFLKMRFLKTVLFLQNVLSTVCLLFLYM